MAKKRKHGLIHLRFRKNDPAHNLLAAAQHYIKARGGAVVVIGGIQIIKHPFDPEASFQIAVRCVGRLPKKVAEKK